MGTLKVAFSSRYDRRTIIGGEVLPISLRRGSMRRLFGALLLGIAISFMLIPSTSLADSKYEESVDPVDVIRFYSYRQKPASPRESCSQG